MSRLKLLLWLSFVAAAVACNGNGKTIDTALDMSPPSEDIGGVDILFEDAPLDLRGEDLDPGDLGSDLLVDAAPDVSPFCEPGEELCDGIDNDCDGDVDEALLVEGQYVDLCDDGLDCTDDLCGGEDGCEYVALTGTDCDDGDPCTLGDHCADGVCAGEPVGCDCQVDADCAGLEDGDLCTGTLYCNLETVPFRCDLVPDSPVLCPEAQGIDAPCLAPVCDGETGACSLAPANEGAPCDDGDACSVGDVCAEGQCQPGAVLDCDDANPCTDDSCEPLTGCVHGANTASCDDGNACTSGDVCVGGQCQFGAGLACNDGNHCTDDSCDPESGCVYTANAAPCTDDDACTMGDTCAEGACAPGQAVTCADDNLCTDDGCDPLSGCTFTPNAEVCAPAACVEGAWLEAAVCAAGACPDPEPVPCPFLCGAEGCYGECAPGALQCDGLVIVLCDDAAAWQEQETCPVGCAEGACTDPEGPIVTDGTPSNPNLFVDEAGELVVFFTDADSEHADVRRATWTGEWQTETVFEGYRIGRQAVDRGIDGTYHLIMGKFGESSVNYGTGPEWTIDSVVTGIPTGGPTGTLGDDGAFHITTSTSLSDRYYATNSTGVWTNSKVASSSTGTAAMVVDGEAPPTIVYNQWNTRRIYVAEGPNFQSGQTLIQSYGVDQGPPLSMKLFQGAKHLVYAYTFDYYTHYRVRYSTDASGSWQTTTLLDSGPGVSGLDISMDAAGAAHVIFCNKDNDMFYYSDHTGAWDHALILDGTCGTGGLDTVLHDGRIYVVYRAVDLSLSLVEVDPTVLQ